MQEYQRTTPALKAQIVREQDGKPIQLLMSAADAADLAFIADDFSREVLPENDEARRLVAFAMMVSMKLEDCLAARSGLVGQAPRRHLAAVA